MRKIYISDVTLGSGSQDAPLTFRRKLEIAKILDGTGVDVIETGVINNSREDCLLVKSLAGTIRNSTLSVGMNVCNTEGISAIWDALKSADKKRLQIFAPVSAVQMEYLCHKKPAAILSLISDSISKCCKICDEVEFVAADFTRADNDFLIECINNAIQAGATQITLHDEAGNLLPDEFYETVKNIRERISARLGVRCSNGMYLADSCALSAVRAGADEIKVSASYNTVTSLKRFTSIISVKGEHYEAYSSVKTTDIQMSADQIKRMTDKRNQNATGNLIGVPQSESYTIPESESRANIAKDAETLGYDLSEDDLDRVYEAFKRVAAKNGEIQLRELDAIIVAEAFQAPKTFILESYVVNSSNIMSATCHLKLLKDNKEVLESVCCGDGPVDAAFMAIEKLVDREYELDDFQIRSVTQGRESLGEAIVKLRAAGKLFSGRGISTDIVGSSIQAYINAVNKIVFEEEPAQ